MNKTVLSISMGLATLAFAASLALPAIAHYRGQQSALGLLIAPVWCVIGYAIVLAMALLLCKATPGRFEILPPSAARLAGAYSKVIGYAMAIGWPLFHLALMTVAVICYVVAPH